VHTRARRWTKRVKTDDELTDSTREVLLALHGAAVRTRGADLACNGGNAAGIAREHSRDGDELNEDEALQEARGSGYLETHDDGYRLTLP
jgi:hypothetical protein